MSGASFDTLCRRTQYLGGRKCRRAERRIAALLGPFGRAFWRAYYGDAERALTPFLEFVGLRSTSLPTKKST